MTKYLLTIQFSGSAYCGFQVQKNALSVQYVMQDALAHLYGSRLPVQGCSRTDAGVHALDFKLTFSDPGIAARMQPTQIIQALNALLPTDIAVLECKIVPVSFHVRYDVKQKTYEYLIWNAPIRNVFWTNGAWHIRPQLDVNAMQIGAQALVGTHDFSSFTATALKKENKTRTISAAEVQRQENWVRFTVSGDGFLYHMVRIMAGTLVEIGFGRREAGDIADILSACDRRMAGRTAPACGLYLKKVYYDAT